MKYLTAYLVALFCSFILVSADIILFYKVYQYGLLPEWAAGTIGFLGFVCVIACFGFVVDYIIKLEKRQA